MPLAREDGGDLIVIHASTHEGERAIAHFLSSRELGDGVDPSLDLKLGHSPPSVPTMLRQSPAGSLPLRAEVETSHGYASYH